MTYSSLIITQIQKMKLVSYLRQMLRLSKRKIRSKKLDNYGKVRWARAGIEVAKSYCTQVSLKGLIDVKHVKTMFGLQMQ